MSVATKNPFALLDEESPSPPTTAPSKATPAAETTTPAATRGSAKSRGPASRGGGYYRRGGKPRDSGDAAPAGDDAPVTEGRRFDGEGRGRGRGRGRGGDRGDRGRGGRGFRQDRHSASGKVDTEKRVNQGWGADEGKAELNAEVAGATDAVAEEKDASNEWGAPAAADATPADDPWATAAPADGAAFAAPAEGEKPAEEGRKPREREPEEEDNTLTYEQYLAQKKEKAEAAEKLQLREANEGDDSWKDTLAVQKKNEEEDAYFVGKSKSAPKPRAKKEEKVFIEIDARFDRPNRGGRGRGGDRGGRGGGGERGARGRGGPRGGGGGGRGPRQNGTSAAVVNVDDETAFPSLALAVLSE